MSEDLKVSIITVSYNCGNSIAKTMRSVLSQTYKNIEYIIVDGGSTDDTHRVIQSNMDSRIRLIIETDEGIYDAMNKGFSLAEGDIIYFLNCGDYLFDDTIIKEVCSTFISERGIDITYGDVVQYGEKEEYLRMERDSPFHVMARCGVNHQALFVKRSSFYNTRPFNIIYDVYADYDWLLNGLCNHNFRLKYLNMPVVYYQAGGISQQKVARHFPERLHIIRKYFSKAFNISLIWRDPIECLYFIVIYAYLIFESKRFNITFKWKYSHSKPCNLQENSD